MGPLLTRCAFVLGAFWQAALLLGCGAATPAPATPQAPGTPAERFMPLRDGYTYTYETVSEESGERDMFTVRVRRPDARSAQLLSPGTARTLSIDAQGIRRDGTGWVLQAPLHQGRSWTGDNGGRSRIAQTNLAEHVPAGSFSGCLQTVETLQGPSMGTITTVFCPEVGITSMRVENWGDGQHEVQTARLRAFGPPMDLKASP